MLTIETTEGDFVVNIRLAVLLDREEHSKRQGEQRYERNWKTYKYTDGCNDQPLARFFHSLRAMILIVSVEHVVNLLNRSPL
jgi:hypothetical protein